jgi:hypothetical protein
LACQQSLATNSLIPIAVLQASYSSVFEHTFQLPQVSNFKNRLRDGKFNTLMTISWALIEHGNEFNAP